MTDRLYYTDSLLASFDAKVVSSDIVDGKPHVVLDRTAFYPTSGGQPFDSGELRPRSGQAARVVDVIDRDDHEIAHVLDRPLTIGEQVHGAIDWARRFDHMQQHTGQHILSAAFDTLFKARTLSFHLGADTATIDLARELSATEIAAAEKEANRVVWDDRPIVIRFVNDDEAAALPLRKEPSRTGLLRIVDVEHCDVSACGGTHVPTTGRIGVIAIAAWERFKGGSRVTFVCGGRALASHGRFRDAVQAAVRVLSVAPAELAGSIERMQVEHKSLVRTIGKLQEEAAIGEAATLRAQAVVSGVTKVVLAARPGWDAAALKTLAQAIVSEAGYVAVLMGEARAGQPLPVVAARSADASFDAGAWVKAVIAALGGKGGGRPELAQGGVTATADAVVEFTRGALQI